MSIEKNWGFPGKWKKYKGPEKGIPVPLNDNPLMSWDYKKSHYRRIELFPRQFQQQNVQQGGVVPQAQIGVSPTPTPSITPSPTQSETPTQTPSVTPSLTPTMTQTQTPSITPSSTPYPLPIQPNLWFDGSDPAYMSLILSGGNQYLSSWTSKGINGWVLTASNTNTMCIVSGSSQMPGSPNIVRFVTGTTGNVKHYTSLNNSLLGLTGGTFFTVYSLIPGTQITILQNRVYSGLTNGAVTNSSATGFTLNLQQQTLAANPIQSFSTTAVNYSQNISAVSGVALNNKVLVRTSFPNATNQFGVFEVNQSAGTFNNAFTGVSATASVNTYNLGCTISTGGTINPQTCNYELAEIMWFNTTLSNSDIEAIELYLKDKWRYDEWASPVPTPTQTASSTATPTPSITPSQTVSPTVSPTQTNTPTPSSTPPAFNPSSLNPEIWVDFSDTSTMTFRSGTNFLSKITNKGTDTSLTAFTQSTAANQPLVTGSTVFTGVTISAVTCSNDFLTSNANSPTGNSVTFVCVVGRTSSSDTSTSLYGFDNGTYLKNFYWNRNSTSSRSGFFNVGAGTFYRTDVTNPVTDTWSGQTYIEFISTTGGSQLDYYYTNTSAMTESVVVGSNYTQNTPGASTLTLFNNDGTTANIQVGEMFFLYRELTTTERTNLTNYLKTKWGLQY